MLGVSGVAPFSNVSRGSNISDCQVIACFLKPCHFEGMIALLAKVIALLFLLMDENCLDSSLMF